jgi:hypothetical protein
MARPKRTYRSPIVITLAAVAPACVPGLNHDGSGGGPGSGGSVAGDDGGPDGAGGFLLSTGGSVAAGGLIGAGGSWTGGASSGGGSLGGLPNYPECPSGDTLYGFTVPCYPDERCQIEMSCTSGNNRDFVFACAASGEYWALDAQYCAHEAEYCRSTSGDSICQGGVWMYQGEGGNPPAPCPEARPAEGSDCYSGAGFGADRTACGYPCSPDGPWTVTGCAAVDPEAPYGDASWQSDGVCSNEGMGGADP